MNFRIISQITDYIENHKKSLNDDTIESITGMSAGHVRNIFKRVVRMSVDKYRIRRQLSIVIEHIKKNNLKVNECDPAPWESTKGFSRAFKKEFNISPSEFILHYNKNILQMKVDVEKKAMEYISLNKKCDSLTRKYGSKSRALLYLLSLEPYQFDYSYRIFVYSFETCILGLIYSKYAVIKGEYKIGEIPKKFINDNSNNLKKNYNQLNGVNLERIESLTVIPKRPMQDIQSYDYIISNRNIIEQLCYDVNIEKVILNELSPRKLRTLWYKEIISKNIEAGRICLPDSLDIQNISPKIYWYLYRLLFNEQAVYILNTWDELRERIMFDYDQEINKQEILCSKCMFKKDCGNEDECQYFDEMSEEEKDIEFSKPDYVELTNEKLIKDIAALLKQGLIYIEL